MNQVAPNAADRILKMAENQIHHRMNLEDKAVTAQLNQSARGQHYALIIGFATLGTCLALAYMGHPNTAGWIGSLGMGSLGIAFLTGKVAEFMNRRAKVEPPSKEPPRPSS